MRHPFHTVHGREHEHETKQNELDRKEPDIRANSYGCGWVSDVENDHPFVAVGQVKGWG
jgi:hypothetical protein